MLKSFAAARVLDRKTWRLEQPTWSTVLGISAELLTPGAELGAAEGEILTTIAEDVLHPFPGEVWVRDGVARQLEANHFQGLELVRVQIRRPPVSSVVLYSIEPRGKGWRVGSTEASLLMCTECGRRGFPRPDDLSVDRSRWDGSDFFTLDRNPGILVVSERVHDFVTQSGIRNVELSEVSTGR